MSSWNFEDMGDFADDAAAERWAKRNEIDLRDIRTTASGRGVRLEVRRSVRRQNIWHRSRRKLAECGPRLLLGFRRRAYGVASADVQWSVA